MMRFLVSRSSLRSSAVVGLSLLPLALAFTVSAQDAGQTRSPAAPSQAPAPAAGQGQQGGQILQGAEGGQARQGGQGGQGGGRGMGGFGGGGPGGPGGRMGAFGQIMTSFKPDFLRRDIPLFKEQLSFDDGQMLIVETLINDYDLAFVPASDESQAKVRDATMRLFQGFFGGDMREQMRGMQESIQQSIEQMEVENGGPITPETRAKVIAAATAKFSAERFAQRKATGADLETKGVMEEILNEFNRWTTEKSKMRQVVLDGIEGTLTETQKPNWSKFQRFLRREKTMENALLSGEGTNLLLVMDQSGLSQPSIDLSVKSLDDYEVQLDNALRAREEYLEQSAPKLMRAVLDGEIDAAKAIAKRQVALRKSVRDVNDQFRTLIVGAMPVEDGEKFNRAALEAAFRRIYQTTSTQEAFTKALELADLAADVMASIQNLQGVYLAELGVINEKLVAATRKHEPDQRLEETDRIIGMLSGTSFGFGGMMGRSGDPDPVAELDDTRDELNKKFLDQLKALLTPEQQTKLPARRSGGRRGGGQNRFGSGKIADMPENFQPLAKKADKNNDGTLDETEREEMFRTMQEQGGFGGQGGRGGGGGQAGGAIGGGN